MADVTIGADEQGAYEIPLAVGTVVTVQVVDPWSSQVQVIAHTGTAPVYARVGTTVAVKDKYSQVVPTGTWLNVRLSDRNTIALISSAAATVSVTRV